MADPAAHIGYYARYPTSPVHLYNDARTQHVYVIGQTGVGKSTLLKNLMLHDATTGTGFAFIDPHGDDADELLDYIPPERLDDVIYFNAADESYPIAFNPLADIPPSEYHLATEGIIATFKHIFASSWSESRMEYLATNTIAALLSTGDSTLLGVRRMLTNSDYRRVVKQTIENHEVRAFWFDEFPSWPSAMRREAVPPILNKVCQLFQNPILLNILGQQENALNLSNIMDEGRILIINLSEGKIGQRASNLLGSFLITRFYQEAMRRAHRSPDHRPQFHLYVDEFTNFTVAESFSRMLSGARKFGLGLTLAHQYIEQMHEDVRAAVFGSIGTHIAW